jgi:NADH-quinone oxidoreductase subunit H
MRLNHLAAWITLLILSTLALWSCSRADQSFDLLRVLDVTPREVDLGDRIEIIGVDFPEGKEATITFEGDLHRPGQPVQKGVTVKVNVDTSSASRIDFQLTQGLHDQLAGVGPDAVHTTFRGTINVAFNSTSTDGVKKQVSGVLNDVVMDISPPTMRHAIVEAREGKGEKVLAALGIELDENSRTQGGLTVKSVSDQAETIAAKNAGILPGDVLVSLDGVNIVSKADFVPTGSSRFADVGVLRGGELGSGGQLEYRKVEVANIAKGVPTDLVGAGILLLIAILTVGVFMSPTAGIITWVERRMAGRMQSRVGPNRSGPQGFLQWLADGIKSILKEDIIPAEADKPLFRLAPYLVFVGVSATFVVMPFGEYLIAADLDIGILFVVAVTSLVTIGLMTGGWASNNKWSLLGGIRSAAQIISYEIPGAVAIVCIVMMTGSLRMQDIIRAQGGVPWDWYMFRNPVTFLLFFLYFTTALAEGNRAPFDLPEAESELVAGYSTEYSGMRYVFFFFGEWANVFVMSGIAAALFLGGWQVPGVDPMTQGSSFLWQSLGAFIFLGKAWVLIFVVIWIRWTLPRIRIDQLMNLCWKWFVPGSFIAFVLTALWTLWAPEGVVRLAISVATFLVFVGVVIQFGRRVAFNMRNMQANVHLNPFI